MFNKILVHFMTKMDFHILQKVLQWILQSQQRHLSVQ